MTGVSPIEVRRDRIARLQAELAEQARTIRELSTALDHTRQVFDRSAVAARIGVWECRLADERLRWTDVVYDIFDMPRGSDLNRNTTVALYTERSARELERLRSEAIRERSGFSMDAEIVTALGNRRWMRITATVECDGDVPVRLFGLKQDITEEKLLLERTRYLAEYDQMTGLANRSRFQARFAELGEGNDRSLLAGLMIVDLDGFKEINDTHGHAAGDVCIVEMARRLAVTCEGADTICRIGGDEFVILLRSGTDRAHAAGMARMIIDVLGAPVDHLGLSMRSGASIGIAFVGEDMQGHRLYTCADEALYAAKAAGRNTFRFYKPRQGGPFRDERAA